METKALMVEIRDARDADRKALQDVHVASWQDSYVGAFPTTFLASELPGRMANYWSRQTLPGDDLVLVATGTQMMGFIAVEIQAQGPYCHNLHVDPAYRGAGIGGQLLYAAAGRLIGMGHSRLSLDVFEMNTRTRAYYRRLGGAEGVARPDRLFGYDVSSIPVVWTDISALRDRLGA